MNGKIIATALLTLVWVCNTAYAACTPSSKSAYLYIGWPNDGELLSANKPFRVWVGLRNMGVAPKGIAKPNTGHHHLLIDREFPPFDEAIPADRNTLHFGAGQTEAKIELPSGKHTLQLLMGDHLHIPHCPPVYSRKITVNVR